MYPWIEKIKNSIKKYTQEHNYGYIIKHAVSFFIGFILSPLSWWNDIFVNVPLAWAMTWPILKLLSFIIPISKNFFLAVFIFNYWITNIVGMAMMHHSGKKLINKDAKFEIAQDLLIGIIYSIIIAIIFILNPGEILSSLHIIPVWAK
ncbi:MAG: hypothetical protein P1P90_00310 [Patescibacteria group bacterium]|nr:hypothetical protein [Patescibacteria group bacterium]